MAEPHHSNCDSPRPKPLFEEFFSRTLREQACLWLCHKFRDSGLAAAEAEDLVAEALADLAPHYDAVDYPKTYLYRRLRWRAIDYLKQRSREKSAAAIFLTRTEQERYVAQIIKALLETLTSHLTKRELAFLELRYLSSEPLKLRDLAERWSYTYDSMRQYASAVLRKVGQILLEADEPERGE
jgi:RNA polymerase sigma factor (sigma-70 family)